MLPSFAGEANIKVFLILEGSLPGILRIDLLGATVFIVLVVFVVSEVGVASPLPRFFADLSLKIRIIQVDRYNTVSRLPEYLLTDF